MTKNMKSTAENTCVSENIKRDNVKKGERENTRENTVKASLR